MSEVATEGGDSRSRARGSGNSRLVTSGQCGIHSELERLVRRHFGSQFRRPIGELSRIAVDGALARQSGRPLILDSGCGVGESTAAIGERFPEAYVVGIDKSEARLGKLRALPANATVIRADLVDAWRHLRASGVRLDRHYLLYPNPWPKIGHLARRWYGHPVFPDLLALGGTIEIRSNWRIYVEEFCAALQFACRFPEEATPRCEVLFAECPLTPFERKYRDSGQTLYRAQCDLRGITAIASLSSGLLNAAE